MQIFVNKGLTSHLTVMNLKEIFFLEESDAKQFSARYT